MPDFSDLKSGGYAPHGLRREIPACLCTGYDPQAPQFGSLRGSGREIVETPFDEARHLSVLKSAMSSARDPVAS